MVSSGVRCPSSFITAGSLTPARRISEPKECRKLVWDKPRGDPGGGNEVSPETAQLADELVAATGAGQEKAIGGGGGPGGEEAGGVPHPTHEQNPRDHALGFVHVAGDKYRPPLCAGQAA